MASHNHTNNLNIPPKKPAELKRMITRIGAGSDTKPIIQLLHYLQPFQDDCTSSLWGSFEPSDNLKKPRFQNFTLDEFSKLFDVDISEGVIVRRDPVLNGIEYVFVKIGFVHITEQIYNASIHVIFTITESVIVYESDSPSIGKGTYYFEAKGWSAYFGDKVPFVHFQIQNSNFEGDQYLPTPKSRSEIFRDKLTSIIHTALTANWSVVDTITRIKSYKFSTDNTFIDCARIVVPLLLDSFVPQNTDDCCDYCECDHDRTIYKCKCHCYHKDCNSRNCSNKIVGSFENFVVMWKQLLCLFFPREEQIEFLLIIQDFIINTPVLLDINSIVHFLCEECLVDENSLREWEIVIKENVKTSDLLYHQISELVRLYDKLNHLSGESSE